jgi:chromosome segregation ATPase
MSSVAMPVYSRRSRLLGVPADKLALRVVSKEHHGREFSLQGAKCSVGSARGCTLRLRGAGVGPLHCLILRGAGGTIIRRRSPRTLLNGAPFDDAPLRPGDRLQVGPVELEIVDCAVVDESWQAGSAALPPLAALTRERDQLETAAEAALREAASLRRTVAELESQSAARMTELTVQLAELAAERDALSARLESTELLAAERASLLAEQSAIVESLTAGKTELAEMRSHLAARENEIEGMLQEETRRVSEIQSRLEDALRERQALESRLREQTDALRGEAASREQEREHLIGECERLDEELNKLRELVGYTAAERDQLTLQVGHDQQRLVGELRGLREQQSELAQVHRERAQLQERLDQVQGELVAAQKQLAVLQVEGDHHLHSEMQQTTELRRLLEQAEFAKSELTDRLERQARDWQLERECLREQAERVSVQCGQLEEQLTNIRTVFDSLAAERDRIAAELDSAAQRGEQDASGLARERDELTRQLAESEDRRCRFEEQLAEQKLQAESAQTRLAEIQSRANLAEEWQRQATEANDRVAYLQEQLADVEVRLETATTELQAELTASRQSAADWECKAGELQVQLSAAQLKLTAAESQLEEKQSAWRTELSAVEARSAELAQEVVQTRGELSAALAQLANVESREAELLAAASLDSSNSDANAEVNSWQTRVAAAECARQQLESQLDELSDKIRFERETWHTDRERLHQECRMLGQRLIQQQRELDAARDDLRQLRQSSAVGMSGQTITMDQLGQLAGGSKDEDEFAAEQRAAEERAAWEAERQELNAQIARLEQALEDRAAQPLPTGGEATLGVDAVAALQPNALAAELAEQLARLESAHSEEVARREQAEATAAESAAAREHAEQSLSEAQAQLAEADGLRQQLVELQQQLATDHSAATDAGQRLAALEAELAQRQAEFEQLQQQLASATESHDHQSDLGTERNRLEQLQQELAAREQSVERQVAELSHRLALADERLAEAESLRTELQRERETLAIEHATLTRKSASLADSTSSSSDPPALEHAAPASSGTGRSEPHEESASRDSVPLGNLAEQKPVWMQPAAPAPPADDDSIEDYMSRLLRRVRGEGPAPAVPYQFPTQSPPSSPTEPQAVKSASPVVDETVPPDAETQATPYRPRATAPELTTNLKAMRELANSACRTAIAKHQKRRGGREVLGRLIGVGLALVASGLAAGVALVFNSWLAGFAALVGVVAVAYWTLRTIVSAFQIMRLSSSGAGDVEPNDEPVTPSQPDAGLASAEGTTPDSPRESESPIAVAELDSPALASDAESAGEQAPNEQSESPAVENTAESRV